MIAKVKEVSKEQIKSLRFPKEEVLKQRKEQQIRFSELNKAMVLGNLEKQKVKIYFADDKGLKRVETTIWAVTDRNVVLKQSTLLPLERIIAIT